MKWPNLMLLVRHDVSTYNVLRDKKARSSLYREFLAEFSRDSDSETTRALARMVQAKFSLGIGDADTPLLDEEARRAEKVGAALRRVHGVEPPEVIFVSPYRRTKLTLAGLMRGWPEIGKVKVIEDERIREQEHGLSLVYNDWRVFHALHPEQKALYKLEGPYWYRYPQGENVPDVRERVRSWTNTIVRDFAERRIMAVTHHLSILALRANLERWDARTFQHTDKEDKPINCGVTVYRGYPDEGQNGRFRLDYYNHRFYRS